MDLLANRTEEQLKQIAKDIHGGLIFTTEHIPKHDAHMTSTIFMALMFLNDDDRKALIKAGEEERIGMIYEYYSEALPRSVNGYPMFTSMWLVNSDDKKKIDEYIRKLQEFSNSL